MNEGYAEEAKRAMVGAQRLVGIDHNPTVEENIDEKIRYYESEIARLKQSKEDLSPLLKMRIRDIRQAMEY
jgi:prefoldin subunit 5